MRYSRGLSLLELLVAVSIMGLLFGLALPSFTATLERQRVRTALFHVSAQFAMARNTAIMRRHAVTLCPTDGGDACLRDSDWSRGWMMYRRRGRTLQPDAPEDVLRVVQRPVHPSLRLRTSAGRRALHFLPSGRSGGSNLSLRVCLKGRLRGEVVVNNLGRTRSRMLPGTQSCP